MLEAEPRLVRYQTEGPNNELKWNRGDLIRLAEGISGGNVVGYVGAGPSKAAGLPDWAGLCNHLYNWVCSERKFNDLKYLKQLIEEDKNFLLFSQILENRIGKELGVQIAELCSQIVQPSPTHTAIATLPLSLVLTTNYDHLLQKAFDELPAPYGKPRERLTWKEGSKILRLVRDRRCGLIKVHGDIDDEDSIVLTKSNYRRLSNDPGFRSVLKSLISTHSFLFIGCSLRDPDIFSLLDQVLEECKLLGDSTAETPLDILHYALLPEPEVKPAFIDHLRRDYGIATFLLPENTDLPLGLRIISAEVARLMTAQAIVKLPPRTLARAFSEVSFCSQNAIKALLPEIIQYSGSHRADVALATGDDAHVPDWRLRWNAGSESKEPEWKKETPPPHSVVGSAFSLPLEAVYIPDTDDLQSDLNEEAVSYECADEKVKSELAVPIAAEGNCIGVLNVESYLNDAYRAGHIEFMRRCAIQIGAFHLEAQERNRRTGKFKEFANHPQRNLINVLGKLCPQDSHLTGLTYTADYMSGTLTAIHRKGTSSEPIRYTFDESPSFASSVFRRRKSWYLADVEQGIRNLEVHGDTAKRVGIRRGPLFGTPVYDRGLMCAILVLWQDQQHDESQSSVLSDASRRVLLAAGANLILAGLTQREGGEEKLNDVFGTLRCIEAAEQADLFKRAMEAVLRLGLRRARLWLSRDRFFECVHAEPADHGLQVLETTETWERDTEVKYSDYCALVRWRYMTDPWARVQGPAMFNGLQDPTGEKLGKKRDGEWIVAPLVTWNSDGSAKELLGYLAADNHSDPVGDGRFSDEDERNWFQLGMSVIAVVTAKSLSKMRSRQRH